MQSAIEQAGRDAPALWGRAIASIERYRGALSAFRARLRDTGCSPRQQDQLGAMLAGWWILTRDGVPDQRAALDGVVAIAEFVLRADEIEAQSAARVCAERLARLDFHPYRSTEQVSVAELCMKAWQPRDDGEVDAMLGVIDARRDLARIGIRPVRADEQANRNRTPVKRGGPGDGIWINAHSQQLDERFGESFAKRWVFLLRSLQSHRDASASLPEQVTIGSVKARAVIWLSRYDLLGGDNEC
jgi:hypothetical protein